jgi:hypothetical protein
MHPRDLKSKSLHPAPNSCDTSSTTLACAIKSSHGFTDGLADPPPSLYHFMVERRPHHFHLPCFGCFPLKKNNQATDISSRHQ